MAIGVDMEPVGKGSVNEELVSVVSIVNAMSLYSTFRLAVLVSLSWSVIESVYKPLEVKNFGSGVTVNFPNRAVAEGCPYDCPMNSAELYHPSIDISAYVVCVPSAFFIVALLNVALFISAVLFSCNTPAMSNPSCLAIKPKLCPAMFVIPLSLLSLPVCHPSMVSMEKVTLLSSRHISMLCL